MARPPSDHPTDVELQILKILWENSPLRVRDVRMALVEQGRDVAHTSVITILNIMVRKKYVKRTKQKNAFLFEPRVTREDTARSMLSTLLQHSSLMVRPRI